jgi:hypothetical protein
MGSPVLLSWTPDAGLSASAVQPSTYFRGRVTGVSIGQPEDFTTPAGVPFRAVRVDLELTSVETDWANVFAPPGTSWPAETISARAARIAALAGVPVTIRGDWATAQAAAMSAQDLANASVRDLLLQLYSSTGGDRLIYSPHTHSYEWMGRRQVNARTLGTLVYATNDATNARANRGVYPVPALGRYPTGVTTSSALRDEPLTVWMDGHWMTSSSTQVSKQAAQRITQARVAWKDSTAADADRTAVTVDPAANEAVIGQRAITLDSVHNVAAWATLNAQDLLAQATQEGAQWRPPRLRWDTRAAGFEMRDQLQVALRGHATWFPVWVARAWFTELGIRPVFSAIGGTIIYADGRFVVELQMAGWTASGGGNASPVPVKQHMVTWEELDQSTPAMTWTDGPALRGFHESVTYEDLGFVGIGFGANDVIGPDTGWDEYQ